MPKRTNAYQRLVKLVHTLYAPQGATVSESKMVKAPGFGDLREIDVLMETAVGPYTIKFAIEAKNHKRKLSVTDVDSIVGKYRCGGALIVNEIILVCPMGYSIAAGNKARANGIKLVTFSELKDDGNAQNSNKAKIKFEVQPHPAHLNLAPFPTKELPDNGENGTLYCKCCGRTAGKPQQFAAKIIQTRLADTPMFTDRFNQKLTNDGFACARVKIPMGRHQLDVDGHRFDLLTLESHVHATRMESDLEFKTYEMSGGEIETSRVRHGSAQIDNQEINIVFDADKRDRITFNFRDCSGD